MEYPRITKKPFGIFITTQNSPVQPERFSGYHTGVDVEYKDAEGRIVGDSVRIIDFDNPDNNDWLAVNQFTVVENHINRRPDVVIFINGLPLAVIELKNASIGCGNCRL